MGITDRASGRIKKATADLTGDDALHREGAREERKADAEEEARRSQDRADLKAAEARRLEHKTDPEALDDDMSKDELYRRAQELGIEGRSDMTKDELAAEVARRE